MRNDVVDFSFIRAKETKGKTEEKKAVGKKIVKYDAGKMFLLSLIRGNCWNVGRPIHIGALYTAFEFERMRSHFYSVHSNILFRVELVLN